jgi:mono/diheme cytochrome c family protein
MALIQQQCAACHGARLEGRYGPPLSGPRFLGHWGGRSAEELRRYILARMPLGQPGTLTPQQTLDLLVYLLQANGLPSAEPLSLEALPNIIFPKP